jgi:methylenetetrahydrofolate reductase (NADPH)
LAISRVLLLAIKGHGEAQISLCVKWHVPHSTLTSNQANEALSQWGNPKSLNDLTDLFVNHLHGKAYTPFSGELSPESSTILEHLERLNKRGWWTVGSQPAVDGVDSTHPVFGWGPRGGYVFQKGFVEFFCEEADADAIERRISESGRGWVDYFMSNQKVGFLLGVGDVLANDDLAG